jgi:2-dehydropantoate 2-reductase
MSKLSRPIHIGIVGQGAIGIGLAQLIENYNITHPTSAIDCSLFVREPSKQARSIITTQTTISSSRDYIFSEYMLSDAAKLQELDLLILPIKLYQLSDVIIQLKALLPPQVALFLLQNGMGGHEQLAKAFPDNPLYLGTTTDAVQRMNPEEYKVHARGELLIGSDTLSQPCAAITQLISRHPKGAWVSHIMDYLYKKLAVNAVINPLSAIHACANGQIRAYTKDIAALKKEIRAVYTALEVGLELDELEAYIDSVIELTQSNYSSMYQDVKNQRPTEVDGILGTLQTKAAQLSIAVPKINDLYQQIKAIEQSYS